MLTHRETLWLLAKTMFNSWATLLTFIGALVLLSAGFFGPDPDTTLGKIFKAADPYRYWVAGSLFILSSYITAFRAITTERNQVAHLNMRVRELEKRLEPQLELAFDLDDPSCIRQWTDTPHTLFRVRVINPSKSAVNNVRVKIHNMKPLILDYLGTQLLIRHEDDSVDSFSLGPEESNYVDVLEYNSWHSAAHEPDLVIWHTVPWLSKAMPVQSYEITLVAYSDETNSRPVQFLFSIQDRIHYHFQQIR